MGNETSAELFARNVHPRIFFGPSDIPAIRQKAKSGIPARAAAEILRRAAAYTDPGSRQYVDASRGRAAMVSGWANGLGNSATDALHCLGFAYILTGDAQWPQKAAPILLTAIDQDAGDGSMLEGQLPLAYDMLHDALEPAARDAVGAYIRRCCVEGYQKHWLGRMIWGIGTNIFLHTFEKYAFSLAAVYDPRTDRARLEEVADLLRRSVHKGVDEGGAIFEGPSYGQGDASWLSCAAEILRRAGIADMWQTEPRFASIARHWAYLILPGRRGQNTPCDAWRMQCQIPNFALLLSARRTNDPVMQWAWEQMRYRDDIDGQGTSPERFATNLGLVMLWEDDAAVARRPDQQNWPTSRNSGAMGFMTMRTGFGDDDIYFSLMASARTPGVRIHQHLDGGHFCLFAHNEAYSVDTGYGDNGGAYHSVLRPEGRDPRHSPDHFDQVHTGGSPVAFAASQHADYGCVDIGRQWESMWSYRHAMLIKAPHAEPYVVILDDCNYCDDSADYEWLMNSEPGNRVELNQTDDRATVLGRVHRLDIAWAYPGEQGYQLQHRLELAADEIDSRPLNHRTHDVNYLLGMGGQPRPRGGGRWGIGVRPRVKARLSGYTGQLLTALMPRRAGSPAAAVQRLTATTHFAMVIDSGDVVDTIVASPGDRHIALGGMAGEAALAIARRDRAGKLLWWAAADAYALAIDGRQVLSRQAAPIVMVNQLA